MTETLKRLMDDLVAGAEPGFAPVDLDRVLREGDRTRRRRRTAWAAGAGLAAAGVMAAMLVVGGGPDTGRGVDTAGGAGATAPVSWIRDGVLHSSAGDVELGFAAVAYVRTAAGYVVVAEDGSVHAVADGETSRVGATRVDPRSDQLLLVTDPAGTTVTWVGSDGAFVTYDLADRSGRVFGNPDGGNRILAADGDVVYVHADGAAASYDLTTGTWAILDGLLLDRPDILGAGGGLVATTVDETRTDTGGIRIAEPGERGVVVTGAWSDLVTFSPDASYVSFDADELAVRTSADGAEVALDMGGRPFASAYEWLDEDTVAAIASPAGVSEPEAAAQLITCDVVAGDCAVAVDDLGGFDELLADDFVLPTGTTIG